MQNQECRIEPEAPRARVAMKAQPEIYGRTYRLGVRILMLVRALPRDVGAQVLARQIARSGTAIGSNLEEAHAACSRREFTRKINIARSEARETHYWLRLMRDAEILPARRLTEIISEAGEIVAILTAIEKQSRRKGSADAEAEILHS
jgi:four helix bundle protein